MQKKFFKTITALAVLILLTFNDGFGQVQIKGQVMDEQRLPLTYATVILSNLQDDGVTHSDSNGYFYFKDISRGNYRLSAYSIGYQKQADTLNIQKDTAVTIVLKALNKTLKEVTVTENKPIIIRKPDRLIFDVTNSIGAAGGNGLETIGQAPGIKINNDRIVLSGKGEVAVKINGRQLHLSGKSLIRYLKSFSAGQISKVEIITHPSAANEAAGSGGVLNIITKQSAEQGLNGTVGGSLLRSLFTDPPYYGVKNYGYANGNLNLNFNKGKWSAYGSTGYTHGRQLEGYAIDIRYPQRRWYMKDTGDFKHPAANVMLGADYRISQKSAIGFQYLYEWSHYDGADHAKGFTYNTSGSIDSTLKTFADYYPLAYSNSFNLHYLHNLNHSGASLLLNADYFNYYRTDISNFINESYDASGKLNPGNTVKYLDSSKQNIKIYTLKADVDIPSNFAKWKMGGKLNFIDNYSNIFYYRKQKDHLILNPDLSDEFQYDENTQALYVSGSKDIKQWEIQAGLRTEMMQTKGRSSFDGRAVKHHYFKIFPSLLVSLNADDNNHFSITYDKRINRPSFWTLNPYKSLMTPYSYVEGNPYLQPEYTTHIAVFHEYKNILTSSLWVNIINDGFWKVTHADPDSNLIYTRPLNFIHSGTFGISESVSATPFKWLETHTLVNVYYTDAKSSLSYISGIKGMGMYLSTNNSIAFNSSKTVMGEIDFWCQFPEIDHFGKSDTYYNLDVGVKVLALKKRLTLALTGHDLLQSTGSVFYSTVNHLQQSYTNFQVFSNVRISASYHFGTGEKHKEIHTGNEVERKRVE